MIYAQSDECCDIPEDFLLPFTEASKQVRYCNNMDDTCTEVDLNQFELGY